MTGSITNLDRHAASSSVAADHANQWPSSVIRSRSALLSTSADGILIAPRPGFLEVPALTMVTTSPSNRNPPPSRVGVRLVPGSPLEM